MGVGHVNGHEMTAGPGGEITQGFNRK